MSVKSVSTGLPPYYSPLSGNTSPTAKPAALAKQLPESTFAKTDVTSADDGATRGAFVTGGDTNGVFQRTLEQELREGGTTAGARRSTDTASGSPAGRSSPGIALYQRISQYGNNEPATSALLKSWNNVMQGGRDADSAAAAFAKALAQNEVLASTPGVLDLTA